MLSRAVKLHGLYFVKTEGGKAYRGLETKQQESRRIHVDGTLLGWCVCSHDDLKLALAHTAGCIWRDFLHLSERERLNQSSRVPRGLTL